MPILKASASEAISSSNSLPSSSLKKAASSTVNNASNDKKKIVLVVDDTRFMVDRNLFTAKPDTMLAKMFSHAMLNDRGWTKPNERGEYEMSVPISAIVFKAILEFYTEGRINCPPGVNVNQLRSACEYFLIPFDHHTIKCHNLGSLMHEISNDGAEKRFIGFLEECITPVLVKVARNGDRECHIVVLTDDDVIQWDPSHPPMVGEEYTETVQSTPMHRFFRYIENREVAKRVLKDRGMKKIKLGIEGYPIGADQVKRRSDGRQEIIYDFVQRSFIVMSWEKEESRSRHVDFQCVNKSKSITNLAAAAADTPQDRVLIQAEAMNMNELRDVLVPRDDVEPEENQQQQQQQE